MSEELCIHVIIRGRVQGVYYRAWTVGNARERGLKGWVRNRTDGTVEAVFCGLTEAVEAMLEACMEGPPSAKVEHVHRHGLWEGEKPDTFHQLPTA